MYDSVPFLLGVCHSLLGRCSIVDVEKVRTRVVMADETLRDAWIVSVVREAVAFRFITHVTLVLLRVFLYQRTLTLSMEDYLQQDDGDMRYEV